MIEAFIHQAKPIQWYIIFTSLMTILFVRPTNLKLRLIVLIMVVNGISEIGSIALQCQHTRIGTWSNVVLWLHHCLYLLLLICSVSKRKIYPLAFIAFVLFAVINFFFITGIVNYNFDTFIIGSFLYLIIFIHESFYELKRENFQFFLSNHYLVLIAPVLFFFGISAVFAFKDYNLPYVTVFGGIGLYAFVVNLVNIVYYSLINIYIYRKKFKHAE